MEIGRRGKDAKHSGPTPMCGGLELGGYLRSTPSGARHHSPTQAPQAAALVPGKGAPTISGYKNQQGLCPSR